MGPVWKSFTAWMSQVLPLLPGLAQTWKMPQTGDVSSMLNAFYQSSLIYLFAEQHEHYAQATRFLKKLQNNAQFAEAVRFVWQTKSLIQQEVETPAVKQRLNKLAPQLTPSEVFKETWKVFFPEGLPALLNRQQAEAQLRRLRQVKIVQANQTPIQNPARQILFTSNVLLRPPLETLENLSPAIQQIVKKNQNQPQKFWYDHPIPLDAPAENNEILYGLNGLDQALAFEKQRGNLPEGQKLTCVLSCSVTHDYLHQVARDYVRGLIHQQGGFRHLNVYLFTEEDSRLLVEQVLIPAVQHYWGDHQERFEVFGTDGEYGRHYTFLKAIAALWQTVMDPEIKATFKIDLDQVFPQEKLVQETGQSAFELFQTPLWGAQGIDANQQKVQLDMIAGALVNAQDVDRSIFTPDVPYPPPPTTAEEHIFYSKLPQALSTQVEMMTRYQKPPLDGRSHCLQRVHVTGGTNGILIRALFTHQPFTPSFFGRAEDQAFILSVFDQKQPLLRYLHQPGLIMRHDKQLFAQKAIQAAELGKIIGDYVRMIYFSAYARHLHSDIDRVKSELDPFTGSFISPLPIGVAMLRFLLKGHSLIEAKSHEQAQEFLEIGVQRLQKALQFVQGTPSLFSLQLEKEQRSWQNYYQTLQKWAAHIKQGEHFALSLKDKAQNLIKACRL